MALNFPSSPTIGQIYTDTISGFSYEWDGTVWRSFSPSSSSQIRALDDISGSFDNTTTTFPLTSNGTPITPASPQSLIINLGGVIQDPTDDYSISGSNITFSTPPASGLSFSGISLGPAVPINTIPDGTVTDGSLEVNTDLLVNRDVVIAGILTVGTSSLTLDGDANTINGVTISSGIITATAFFGDGSGLIGVGVGTEDSINISGIITASSFGISGTTIIDNDKNLVNAGRIYTTVSNNQTTSKTLGNREFVSVVGAGLTMTLPASPAAGNEVAIQVGNFTNTVIGRNSQNIMGLAENMTIDVADVTVNLFFTDATRGWRVV